jgi:transposase
MNTQKTDALKALGVQHPHPERVTDSLFQDHDFFDPHDIVQVKYEMIRRVKKEGKSVTEAAAGFGFSRVAFYQAQAAYEAEGLAGLIPEKRGPRHARKLSPEVMAFVERLRHREPDLSHPELARRIEERFGFTIHVRSVERALERGQKKQRSRP